MFDKSTIQAIQSEISAALKQIAEKHNLTMAGTRVSYTDSTFKLNVQFGDNDTTGGVNPVYFKDLQRHGFVYGLSTSMIGKKVKTSKGELEFQGMRGKYAILKDLTNKFWKYDPMIVANLIKE